MRCVNLQGTGIFVEGCLLCWKTYNMQQINKIPFVQVT